MSPGTAVVLAAGRGRRMGGTGKAAVVLPDGRSMLEACLDALRAAGIARTLVVLRPGDRRGVAEARRLGMPAVSSRWPEAGPLGSVRTALLHRTSSHRTHGPPDVRPGPLLLHPVDHPWVRPATLVALLRVARGRRFVVPRFGGRGGHPVTLGPDALAPLASFRRTVTLREALRVAARRVELPVDDPGVLANLNRPEELRVAAAFGHFDG